MENNKNQNKEGELVLEKGESLLGSTESINNGRREEVVQIHREDQAVVGQGDLVQQMREMFEKLGNEICKSQEKTDKHFEQIRENNKRLEQNLGEKIDGVGKRLQEWKHELTGNDKEIEVRTEPVAENFKIESKGVQKINVESERVNKIQGNNDKNKDFEIVKNSIENDQMSSVINQENKILESRVIKTKSKRSRIRKRKSKNRAKKKCVNKIFPFCRRNRESRKNKLKRDIKRYKKQMSKKQKKYKSKHIPEIKFKFESKSRVEGGTNKGEKGSQRVNKISINKVKAQKSVKYPRVTEKPKIKINLNFEDKETRRIKSRKKFNKANIKIENVLKCKFKNFSENRVQKGSVAKNFIKLKFANKTVFLGRKYIKEKVNKLISKVRKQVKAREHLRMVRVKGSRISKAKDTGKCQKIARFNPSRSNFKYRKKLDRNTPYLNKMDVRNKKNINLRKMKSVLVSVK